MAGSTFFGIDSEYLVKVQMKEIFHLIEHGFSYESLDKMSIERRRYYFNLLVEKLTPKKEAPPGAARNANFKNKNSK